MGNTLIFRKQPKRITEAAYRIRTTGEAYNVVEMIANAANMTQQEVASKMIMFAAEHYTIEGGDEKA